MLIIALLLQLVLVFALYFAGVMGGFRLGGNAQAPKIAIAVAILSAIILVASFFTRVGGLAVLAQFLFPLSLGAYRGAKFRAKKDQGGSKGGPTDDKGGPTGGSGT